jgi:hypothetical protein
MASDIEALRNWTKLIWTPRNGCLTTYSIQIALLQQSLTMKEYATCEAPPTVFNWQGDSPVPPENPEARSCPHARIRT